MVVYRPVPPWRGDILVPGQSVPLINPARLGVPQRAAFFFFFFKEMVCCQGLIEEVVISGQHQWRGTGDLFACRQHFLQEGRLPAL